MTKEEMAMLLDMFDERLDKKLDPIKTTLKEHGEKLDKIAFEVKTVYEWVDGIDLDVRELKKAK